MTGKDVTKGGSAEVAAFVERLRGRGTEDEATQARRLETAKRELEAGSEADHRLVNVEIEETVAALVSLLGLACDPLIEGSH